MSSLKAYEKVVFEKLFDRNGYVLDFTDNTYREFFNEFGLQIDHQKYRVNGTSKMKRLRTFWEMEPDPVVGKVLEGLLQYAEAKEKIEPADKVRAMAVINRLLGRKSTATKQESSEAEFLNEEFLKLDLSLLNLDLQFQKVIDQRIDEIKRSLKSESPLAVIFLCGSTLEGLLLDVATKNPQAFNTSKSAPADKSGKVKELHDWTLDNLINVAHEAGFIQLDIKKFSHDLRDFRNYIHPRQQAVQRFNPDTHTAKISWQVLQATIASLTGKRSK